MGESLVSKGILVFLKSPTLLRRIESCLILAETTSCLLWVDIFAQKKSERYLKVLL